MKQMIISVLLLLNVDIVLAIAGECTKFTSWSNLDKSVMVQGRCVYGFRTGKKYSDARSLCESEGTQLIVLKTKEKQAAVWNVLGTNFNKHWMGLTKRDGTWQWKDEGAWIPMTSPRWLDQKRVTRPTLCRIIT